MFTQKISKTAGDLSALHLDLYDYHWQVQGLLINSQNIMVSNMWICMIEIILCLHKWQKISKTAGDLRALHLDLYDYHWQVQGLLINSQNVMVSNMWICMIEIILCLCKWQKISKTAGDLSALHLCKIRVADYKFLKCGLIKNATLPVAHWM